VAEQETSSPYILRNGNVSVDLTMVYEISGNDESYIALMAQIFLQNMPATLQRIGESVQKEDWEEVYKAAHFAKSSLSVIRVSPMLELVLTIEECARKRIALERIEGLTEQVNDSFVMAKDVLSEKFNGGL
jgi:HPt (histidine-containing phosphotransfer) domain-containing protein